MGTSNIGSFKKFRLVDENEIVRLIEKRLKDYNPTLNARARLHLQMSDILQREDLSPEEKLALFTANQQQYRKLQKSATTAAPPHVPEESILPPPPPELGPAAPAPADDSVSEYHEASDDLPFAEGAKFLSATPITPAIPKSQKAIITTASSSMLPPLQESPSITGTFDSNRTLIPQKEEPVFSDRVRGKRDRLLHLLDSPDSPIRKNENTGEIVIDGHPIQHSNFTDLVNSLYDTSTISSSKSSSLIGQPQFYTALVRLFKAKSIRNQSLSDYIASKQVVRDLGGQVGRGLKKRKSDFPPGKQIKALHLYR